MSGTWNGAPEQRRKAYLAKADEARAYARTVMDEQAKQLFEKIAARWEELAEQIQST